MDKQQYEDFNYFKHWDDFTEDEIGITCESREAERKMLKFLDSQGFIWNSGKKLIHENGDPTIERVIKSYVNNHSAKRLTHGLNTSSSRKIVVFKKLT